MRRLVAICLVMSAVGANAQTLQPSSVITAGTTPVVGGTNGCLLFQSGTSIGCNNQITTLGTGNLQLGNGSANASYSTFGTAGSFQNIDNSANLRSNLGYNTNNVANHPTLQLDSGGFIGFSSTAVANGTFDIALARNAAGVFEVDNGTAGTFREMLARSYIGGGSAPTSSGSCAVTSQVGGNTVGSFVAAGSCAGGTYILGFSFSAPNGWSCDGEDRTTTTDTVQQTASTVTNATFKATTASADVVSWKCTAY